jgi:hypothetical protein
VDLYDDRIVRVNFCAVAAATPAGEPPIADASLYAEVLNNLALVCEAQRKHREALALLLLSESVTEVAHGPRDPRSWQVLINIGCIQSELAVCRDTRKMWTYRLQVTEGQSVKSAE